MWWWKRHPDTPKYKSLIGPNATKLLLASPTTPPSFHSPSLHCTCHSKWPLWTDGQTVGWIDKLAIHNTRSCTYSHSRLLLPSPRLFTAPGYSNTLSKLHAHPDLLNASNGVSISHDPSCHQNFYLFPSTEKHHWAIPCSTAEKLYAEQQHSLTESRSSISIDPVKDDTRGILCRKAHMEALIYRTRWIHYSCLPSRWPCNYM